MTTFRNFLFLAWAFALSFFLFSTTANAQSQLDEWYENESIMNRDNPNNSYYNGVAATEYDFADYVNGLGDGVDCIPCQQINPPTWCFEPGGPCEHMTAPIDSGILILMFGGVGMAMYHFRKNKVALA
jgi:hypothetical protein